MHNRVLHQAQPPPAVNGIQKPPKPGGYADSAADIAFALQSTSIIVVTPAEKPDLLTDLDWSFPDTPEGLVLAVQKARRVLPSTIDELVIWANVVLFATHPLIPTLRSLAADGQRPLKMRLMAQEPGDTEKYDDKEATNDLLRKHGLLLPRVSMLAADAAGAQPGDLIMHPSRTSLGVPLPVIVKPIRGRGSQGVSRVRTDEELRKAAVELFTATFTECGKQLPTYGNRILVEEFLSGDEYTVAVLPPGDYLNADGKTQHHDSYFALPPVRRSGHAGDVMPYSGHTPVARNSAVVSPQEAALPHMRTLCRQCEEAAALLKCRAPIRIDARKRSDTEVVLFDLNMKPNMTGPGRPGREVRELLPDRR